jgi:hypothetical protein
VESGEIELEPIVLLEWSCRITFETAATLFTWRGTISAPHPNNNFVNRFDLYMVCVVSASAFAVCWCKYSLSPIRNSICVLTIWPRNLFRPRITLVDTKQTQNGRSASLSEIGQLLYFSSYDWMTKFVIKFKPDKIWLWSLFRPTGQSSRYKRPNPCQITTEACEIAQFCHAK